MAQQTKNFPIRESANPVMPLKYCFSVSEWLDGFDFTYA